MSSDEKALQIRDWIADWFTRRGKPLPLGLTANADVDYLGSGLIDSVAMIEFIMDMENEFRIRITSQAMADPRFATVSGLVAIIGELSAK